MVRGVGPQVRHPGLATVDELQPDDAGGEFGRRGQISYARPDISDIGQLDHVLSLTFQSSSPK